MSELDDALKNIERNFTGQDKAGVPRAAAALDVIVLMEAARRVANARPMYRQGGLSEAWYPMEPDTDELPDGWLITTEDDK